MSELTRVPTRIQILTARGIIKASERLGKEVTDEAVIRDAAWPLENAAPYPKRPRG